MKRKKLFIIFTILLTILILSVTGRSGTGNDNFPLADLLSRDQGLVIIDNLAVREYHRTNTEHQINARKIVFSENNNRIDLENMQLQLFERNSPHANLSGQYARFDVTTKTGEIHNNVRYELLRGGTLTCEHLIWNMANNEIKVPGSFAISHNSQIIRASNLITDKNLGKGSLENLEAISR